METDWSKLTEACKKAMAQAARRPGLYGGRYVARRYNRKTKADDFIVLADDDPDKYASDEDLDILAQVTPATVHPIGRANSYLGADGTVTFVD